MISSNRLQSSRYELKYFVDESTARAVSDFARSYLVLDEYAEKQPDNAYPIYSIYLDSPAMNMCWATLNGEKNRVKLRCRYYTDKPGSPVFFEIKRRENKVIKKQRTAVKRESVMRLLEGAWPTRRDLVDFTPQNYGSLQTFCDLMSRYSARSHTLVAYQRQAFVPREDNKVRLTFDRKLRTCVNTGNFTCNPGEWLYPKVEGVILEMKFTDRFPKWMRELARLFNLQQQSIPKYVKCVTKLGNLQGIGRGRALEVKP